MRAQRFPVVGSGARALGRLHVAAMLTATACYIAQPAAALSRFDKADCESSAPTSISAMPGDGSWACFDFDIEQRHGAFALPLLHNSDDQLGVEIILWNDRWTAADVGAGDTRWLSTASPRSVSQSTNTFADNAWLQKFIPGNVDSGRVDFDGVDFTSNMTYGGEDLNLDPIIGSTTNNANSGVYAWATNSFDVVLSKGFNYIQMLHPNRIESRAVPAFSGKFMYRIHDLHAPRSLNNVRVGQSTAGLLPKLNVGQETTVQNLAILGRAVSFSVNHEYVEAAYALQGYEYTVKLFGNGVGDLTQNELSLTLPTGYQAALEPNLTFAGGNALQARGEPLFFNGTNTGKFGPSEGTHEVSFESDTTTVHSTWRVPLEASDRGDFGDLDIDVTDRGLAQRVGATSMYDWSVQTSPFVDMSVTVNSITPYPLLSELRNLRLRNWDTDSNNGRGHDVTAPTEQEPFAIFRMYIDDPAWWRMRVRFNGVRDMNGAAGVDVAEAMPPACQPLWEVQVARTVIFESAQGSLLPQPNASGRRKNGYSQLWGAPTTDSQRKPANFDWENFYAGSGLSQDAEPALLNTLFVERGNIKSELDPMQSFAGTQVTRPLWLLVRVSAMPGAIVASSQPSRCGSNNIFIESASLHVDSLVDECRSNLDCMVEGDGHPAEDRAEDSANDDVTRFSRCALQRTVAEDGRLIGRSKCMECTAHDHCLAGQYCHMDSGIERLRARAPDNLARFYVADPESAELHGMCREKSSDVLGRACVSHVTSLSFSSTPAVTNPIIGSKFHQVEDGQRGLTASSQPIAAANRYEVVEADPENDDFARGSSGICGEFRYYNSTGVDDVLFLRPTRDINSVSPTGYARVALWTGVCDAERICRECLPGATAGGAQAVAGTVCLNGRMFSAQDVDGTVRSFTSNTAAGTQLGTTFMVILLIILFAVYMYVQARTQRHVHGLPPMTCCDVVLCCGACSRLGPAPPADDTSKSAATKPRPTAAAGAAAAPEDVKPHVSAESSSKTPSALTAADADAAEAGAAPGGEEGTGATATEA